MGEPAKVRSLVQIVRAELERQARRERHQPAVDSRVVRPTELDEKDSPYALPEAVVMPVPNDESGDTQRGQRIRDMAVQESPTWPPLLRPADTHQLTDPSLHLAVDPFSADDIDGMRTALTPERTALVPAPNATSVPRVDSPTPSLIPQPPRPASSARATTVNDLETLEVDQRLHRVTRPLHPTIKSDPS